MMAELMAYGLLISLLFGLAGVSAERFCALRGWPRFVRPKAI